MAIRSKGLCSGLGDREEVGDDGWSPWGTMPAGRDETAPSEAVGQAFRYYVYWKLGEKSGPQRGVSIAVPEPVLEALRASEATWAEIGSSEARKIELAARPLTPRKHGGSALQ